MQINPHITSDIQIQYEEECQVLGVRWHFNYEIIMVVWFVLSFILRFESRQNVNNSLGDFTRWVQKIFKLQIDWEYDTFHTCAEWFIKFYMFSGILLLDIRYWTSLEKSILPKKIILENHCCSCNKEESVILKNNSFINSVLFSSSDTYHQTCPWMGRVLVLSCTSFLFLTFFKLGFRFEIRLQLISDCFPGFYFHWTNCKIFLLMKIFNRYLSVQIWFTCTDMYQIQAGVLWNQQFLFVFVFQGYLSEVRNTAGLYILTFDLWPLWNNLIGWRN